MSTKRPAPKDSDAPPLPVKQPRLESVSSVTTSATNPAFSFPMSRSLSLPIQSFAGRTVIQPQTSAALIGITGILPTTSPVLAARASPFEFHPPASSSLSTPSVLPISARSLPTGLAGITPNPQATAGSINPFAAAAIGIHSLQHSRTPSAGVQYAATVSPTLTPVIIRPRAASTPVAQTATSLVAASPISPPLPPPPYPASASTVVTTLTEQSSDEFTCSSPSQLLYSPTSIRPPIATYVPLFAATTTETTFNKENRQPVCKPPSRSGSSSNTPSTRTKILKHRKAKLAAVKLKYETKLKEKFFLESGGNMMDFVVWKKKPSTLCDQYLKHHDVDSETSVSEEMFSPKDLGHASDSNKMDTERILRDVKLELGDSKADTIPQQKQHREKKSSHKTALAKASESKSEASSTRIQIPLSTVSPSLQVQAAISAAATASTPKGAPSSPMKGFQVSVASPRPPTRSQSALSVMESSHEDIVMRARQEAEVMKAIAELRREGLWSASRLPKVMEPPRRKTHWDYLLEEMQWLATDFANERRWKMTAAKKLCRSVARQYQEREMHHVRTEKEELLRLRKIASIIAKEVKHFWDSIQKIVHHKQHVLLEEKRKKAMDMHLEFIVDQTEKYSSWLVKGLSSMTPSEPSLTSTAPQDGSDGFLTPAEESDDEQTIDVEEQQAEKDGQVDYSRELHQLQAEGEMPMEDLLASLPPEFLQGNSSQGEGGEVMDVGEEGEKKEKEKAVTKSKPWPAKKGRAVAEKAEKMETEREGGDLDYHMSGLEEEEEDETTIAEQEAHEGELDCGAEVDALQKEGELPLEELLKLYNLQRQSATPETDVEGEASGGEEGGERDKETRLGGESNGEESGSEEEEEEEEEQEQGIELLVSGKRLEEACQTEEGLSNVAAVAEQFQPKGITLATTEVKTTVPFLLRHILREYQHIGLDWLVAMYERKLNGILADEMGLGKTIQTIALLAHLACEKGNWGPHLIIVPTSVMLNWECEFKKWCPAFKILTYFGSFKERKQKRVGWTKRNAFHICITSYNIAVQDHRAFKQKKWKYIVLDEAQNIKNFKSQRWQTLLNFNSQQRLLLTGTPLQNNLMELWSLMHFLMPTVFSSHADFKEWFSNPLSGMVEGSQEYNDSIVRRLHQVLRPFLLRRLKMEVEKQMPKKYEHVVMCRLSKRQRFLYEEFMARSKTKETLASGNFLSVINILMQLRKVCNHPDLFELRPILSPFRMAALEFYTASLALKALEHDPFRHVSLDYLNLHLADYELETEAFVAFRSRQLQAVRALLVDPSSSPSLTSLSPRGAGWEERGMAAFLEDLHLPQLRAKLEDWAFSRRRHVYEVNTRRCWRRPMYGTDLVRAVRAVCHYTPSGLTQKRPGSGSSSVLSSWSWSGYAACTLHQSRGTHWSTRSEVLKEMLCGYEERAALLEETIQRFVITVPPITVPSPTLHLHHPSPSWALSERRRTESLSRALSPRASLFHRVTTATCFHFPETRLIQYDCGKLQTLDVLLRRLKSEGHRVLIFTQMARMLDVLEIFLNYHGHTYLRLDGATPVQKRQFLMDWFNRDERVFCFILSTRSGGLGVNLTGADTVIFYDSDWNPTMDAQAQDRCHRIGQTRDVHIYRLVCDSTVEENILKKADQKRMLGNIAIEGGVFTTDFFKESSLRDLFSVQRGEGELRSQVPSGTQLPASEDQGDITERQIEELLLQAEDETDVQAVHMAKAEQVAEMAEFDENFTAQTAVAGKEEKPSAGELEGSKAMGEFARLEEQLSGVERYAMKFLEAENAEFAAQQLRIAEENIELAKKDWELSHLQSLREEEERLAEEEADDVLLTYDRPETANKIYVDEATGEAMPIWLPPTPPADDTEDYYVDLLLEMAYDTSSTMSPMLLASIATYSEDGYDVFGLWRQSMEIEPLKTTQKAVTKLTKEHVNVPPSLFWRRVAADTLSTKFRRLASHSKKMKSKDQFTPLLEQQPEGPEWTNFEDWILLKSVMLVLEFPLSLTISVPAQTPNWSIVADLTAVLSKVKRSPLQCRERLINVVIPREDHTVKAEELETKKYKSREGSVKKTKSRKDQKTKTLVTHDNGKEQSRLFSHTFDWLLQASSKKKQAPKFAWEGVQKQSMHGDLLKEYGISMDSVQSPMQIALHRAERIQSELPRHSSQVHQLLATGQAQAHSQIWQMARSYHAGAGYIKPDGSYVLPPGRQAPGGISVAPTSQRFQPTPVSNSAGTFSQSKLPQVTTSVPASVGIPTAPQITASASVPVPTSLPKSLATSVAKTYSVSSGVDLGKTIMPLAGRALTQQQFLLLRQTALQQQQQQSPQITTPPPKLPPQQMPQTAQPAQIQQKIPLPTGIEQLRPSVALPVQRFPGVTAAPGTVRTLSTTGRSLQTEEVLALLKQQSLRMAASQSFKAAHPTPFHATRDTLQFHPEGSLQFKQSPPVLSAEGVKIIQGPVESEQFKVEMVDQGQLQKTQSQLQLLQKQQSLQSLPSQQSLATSARPQQHQAEQPPS